MSGVRFARQAILAIVGIGALSCVALAENRAAPDFTLKSLQGSNIKLSEQRGQVVMLNFWATWCGPCRQEMPELEKLHQKYRSTGFQVLGVNIDEDPKNATGMVKKLGVRFPVLVDKEKKVSRLYDVRVMPTTVLVDRNGRWRYTHHGYKPGYESTYDSQIRELLRESGQ